MVAWAGATQQRRSCPCPLATYPSPSVGSRRFVHLGEKPTMTIVHVSTAAELHVQGPNSFTRGKRCTGRDGAEGTHRADGAESGGSCGPSWAVRPRVSTTPGLPLSGHSAPPFYAVVKLKRFRRSLSEASVASLSVTCQSVRGKGTRVACAREAHRAASAAAFGALKSLLNERLTGLAKAAVVNEKGGVGTASTAHPAREM